MMTPRGGIQVAGCGLQDEGRPLVPPMIVLPAGEFIMGESADDKFANNTERPVHRVRFSPGFALGRRPVTVGEYRAFHPEHTPRDHPDWPIIGVSWFDAQAYCAWLSRRSEIRYRLPTEAEWEYACRAGTTTAFSCGDTLTSDDANFFYAESGQRVGPGQRTPVERYGANAFGVFDLHGNVCEWVEDTWHADYLAAPPDGSAWVDSGETRRVIRGGAWDYLPRLLRSSWRDSLAADQRRDNVGFRLAHDR